MRGGGVGGYFGTHPVSKNSAYCFSTQLHSQNCVHCECCVLGMTEHLHAQLQQGFAQSDVFSIFRTLRPQDSLLGDIPPPTLHPSPSSHGVNVADNVTLLSP
jgi:hypothetical protein